MLHNKDNASDTNKEIRNKNETSPDISTPTAYDSDENEIPMKLTSTNLSPLRLSPAPSMSSNAGFYDAASPHPFVPIDGITHTFQNREQLEKHELIHSPTGSVVRKHTSVFFTNKSF